MTEKLKQDAKKSVVVARAIKALERDGRLTPDDVVEEASSPKSPLHQFFEWDNTVAAYKYRLEQARELIKTVTVVVHVSHSETVKVPFYMRDAQKPAKVQGYVSMDELRNDPEAAKASLEYALAGIESMLSNAERIADALGLKGEIVKVRDRVKKLRRRIAPAPAGM